MLSRRQSWRIATAALLPLRAGAADLDASTGPVILAVSGAIERRNAGQTARLDLAQLDAIDRSGFTTATPWHDHRAKFEGVSGAALMKFLGAKGSSVTAIALNDYASTIPMEDFLRHGLLLASRVDGKTLSVRDKGPLWIVYPFDATPTLNTGVYHGRSVWQLARLEIR